MWDLFQGGKDWIKSIEVIHHINKTKDKNYTTISIDTKKHFTKFKSFCNKNSQ